MPRILGRCNPQLDNPPAYRHARRPCASVTLHECDQSRCFADPHPCCVCRRRMHSCAPATAPTAAQDGKPRQCCCCCTLKECQRSTAQGVLLLRRQRTPQRPSKCTHIAAVADLHWAPFLCSAGAALCCAVLPASCLPLLCCWGSSSTCSSSCNTVPMLSCGVVHHTHTQRVIDADMRPSSSSTSIIAAG